MLSGCCKNHHNDKMAVQFIIDLIDSNNPFFLARWGVIELGIVYKRIHDIPIMQEELDALLNNAGVFPITDDHVDKFVKTMGHAAEQVDVLVSWFWLDNEEYIFRYFSPYAKLVNSTMTYPFFEDLSWTRALEGKRVLIIHPFASLIRTQYKRREKLFTSQTILPKFDLHVYKAIQSMGGNDNYSSWSDALIKMEKDISKQVFDIALVGCGAYGMPLGAFIKEKMNKQAIHMGGSLQILFGIKGKRWEHVSYSYDKRLYNQYWIRPTEECKPLNYKTVEDGCYW